VRTSVEINSNPRTSRLSKALPAHIDSCSLSLSLSLSLSNLVLSLPVFHTHTCARCLSMSLTHNFSLSPPPPSPTPSLASVSLSRALSLSGFLAGQAAAAVKVKSCNFKTSSSSQASIQSISCSLILIPRDYWDSHRPPEITSSVESGQADRSSDSSSYPSLATRREKVTVLLPFPPPPPPPRGCSTVPPQVSSEATACYERGSLNRTTVDLSGISTLSPGRHAVSDKIGTQRQQARTVRLFFFSTQLKTSCVSQRRRLAYGAADDMLCAENDEEDHGDQKNKEYLGHQCPVAS
jgi:hypothetical protein